MFKSAWIILALLLLSIGFYKSTSADEQPIDVSIIQLVANPQAFDGKFVRVIGFLRFEFEGNGIYFHRDDYEFAISKNGLWVDIPNNIDKLCSDCDTSYALIEGVFDAEHTGHMGAWSGSIGEISRIENWSKVVALIRNANPPEDKK